MAGSYVTRGAGSAIESARSRALSKMRPRLHAPAAPPCGQPSTPLCRVGSWFHPNRYRDRYQDRDRLPPLPKYGHRVTPDDIADHQSVDGNLSCPRAIGFLLPSIPIPIAISISMPPQGLQPRLLPFCRPNCLFAHTPCADPHAPETAPFQRSASLYFSRQSSIRLSQPICSLQ